MKKFKFKRTILLIAIIMSFGLNLHSILSTEDGDIDGAFNSQGFNNEAEVQAVRLFEVDHSTSTAINDGQSLQPQNRYRLEIDIFDFDSVNDVETLEVRFFYVTTGTSVSEAFEDANTTPDDGSALVLRFTNNKDTGGAFALVTSAGVSWELMQSTVPAVSVTDQAFTFEVEFKISRVAQFSEDLEWHLGLLLTDGFLAEGADLRTVTYAGIDVGEDPLAENQTAQFNMNWYGEISVPEEARVSWPVLLPGSGFDSPNNNATIPAIRYIANGGFARQINSDLNWIATQGGIEDVPNATLNNNTNVAIETTQTPQTFSLSVNESNENYGTSSEDAAFILTAFTETGTESSGTTETGIEMRYEVFIALSRNFQNATYEGKITFLITNLLEVGS